MTRGDLHQLDTCLRCSELRAQGRGTLRMDLFYRWMRKRTGLLMDAGKPLGGRWSFDKDNRKRVKGERPPPLPRFEPDALTSDRFSAGVSSYKAP